MRKNQQKSQLGRNLSRALRTIAIVQGVGRGKPADQEFPIFSAFVYVSMLGSFAYGVFTGNAKPLVYTFFTIMLGVPLVCILLKIILLVLYIVVKIKDRKVNVPVEEKQEAERIEQMFAVD